MTDTTNPRRSIIAPVLITLSGVILIAVLASLPFLAGPPREDGLPDLAKFIGRFHPVILHLPIGMLVWVVVMEMLNVFSKRGNAHSSRAAMGFAAASAVVAALLGFILYHSMPDYDRELAERHLFGGLAFACSAVAAFVIKVWVDSRAGSGAAFYRCVLLASAGIMGFTSHDGASLTHGRGYLTDHAPEPLRRLLGMEPRKPARPDAQTEEQPVYAGVIVPILESKCYACHNAEKQKGRFRMDEYDLLLAGGKEGEGLIPGNSAESNIIVRAELPEDDEEHMPPEGKKDLEDHELTLLKWWIDNGASKDAMLKDLPADEAVKTALAKIVPASAEMPVEKPVVKVDDSLKELVVRLGREFPAAIQFEAQNSNNVVFTAAGLRDKFGDAELAKLGPVLPAMVSMDLSHTRVTDSGVRLLASATALKSLRLAKTEITDASLPLLVNFPQLESLNLYGTQVTNDGIQQLAALTGLKKLYLWQSKVDAAGVSALKEKLPDCEIITGL
ncbi:MAG: hypothetical protein MUF86_09230 [Akkermansiaceae bacterium]|jgi:uncharacterized membrane protein|nr:hypothetical protein [Akkermansiaceae bacterium]